MYPPFSIARLLGALALVLSLLTVTVSGCGSGGGSATAIVPYTPAPATTGAVAIDLFFPAAAKKATASATASANLGATATVRVHLVDQSTHKDVVPPVTMARPAGAPGLTVVVTDVPPGTYDTFIECFDAQGSACGYAHPPVTVIAGAESSVPVTSALGLTLVAVTPLAPKIDVGGTQQFAATATFSDASTAIVTSLATWVSTRPTVASIDGTGLARGLTNDNAPITAALTGTSGGADLTVGPVRILVADSGNARLVWFAEDRSSFVTYGVRGPSAGCFDYPRSAVRDAQGRFYVADSVNNRIVRIDDMTGAGWTTFGTHGVGVGQLSCPIGVHVDARGRIYIADINNERIVRIDDMTGTGWVTFAALSRPQSVRSDVAGRIYFTNSLSQVCRVDDMAGTNLVALGSAGAGVNQFFNPWDLAVDVQGHVYVADTNNDRIVRMDDMSGAGWTTFGTLGTGVGQLRGPYGVHLRSDGCIMISDTSNGRVVVISDMTGAGWLEWGAAGTGSWQFSSPDGTT